jgi:periplasmic protein TonB
MNKFFIIFLFLSSFTFSQVDSSECDKLYKEFQTQDEGLGCFRPIQKMIDLVGGLDTIQSLINYPSLAKEQGIEGKVYVSLIVDSLGNSVCLSIAKGINHELDQEALRVVKLLQFIPAMDKGKNITLPATISIIFKLSN